MRAWLREPLLHFLVIGAAIFFLYRVVSGEEEGPREIVVTEAQIESLAEGFARTWMRPPTAEEIRGLVDDYVREEVYYREAMALGLDRDDTVIRRRLRQKMEFVSDDIAAVKEPTDAELQAYLEANTPAFVDPPTFTFEQLYFSSDRRGEAALADAQRVLAQLNAGGVHDGHSAGRPLAAACQHDEGDAAGHRQRLWRGVYRRARGRAAQPLDRPGRVSPSACT